MKHQTIEQLQSVAEVHADPTRAPMTRRQRLERWADLLEENPSRKLKALSGTEYQPVFLRGAMRADNSPLTVAFNDPLLRAAGLENDTYLAAKEFFEVTDRQLHEIVCHCNVGAAMQAYRAARCVRAAIGLGVLARLRALFL